MRESLSAELVRSLFCGLPRQDSRMAVFVSASDETSGPNDRSVFHYCGFVMSENDWSRFFVPAWQERVLDGPPKIEYLHMTDIRSRNWREAQGLSETDADNRVGAACSVIASMGNLYPIRGTMDAGDFKGAFGKTKMRVANNSVKPFEPDYLAFLTYAYVVLKTVSEEYPDAERVDFVIERKKGISDHIVEFHDEMPKTLIEFGYGHLVPLLGELLPAGKDRVPLQAADVLCWHTQRADLNTLDAVGMKRLHQIAKGGASIQWSERELKTLQTAL